MNIIATDAQPKFSKPGKMPSRSWSLQAGETCPGAIDDPACEKCYAQKNNYRFKPVKALRAHNKQDWKNPTWVDAMSKSIKKTDLHFRWFDSGDAYTLSLANKILAVMAATPDTQHWFPTRMHKFPKFAEVLAKMEALPNVVVRKSTPGIDTPAMAGDTVSVIYTDTPPTGAIVCKAPDNAGKCGSCRACWDSSNRVIAYKFH